MSVGNVENVEDNKRNYKKNPPKSESESIPKEAHVKLASFKAGIDMFTPWYKQPVQLTDLN